jgi:hypothetical protein
VAVLTFPSARFSGSVTSVSFAATAPAPRAGSLLAGQPQQPQPFHVPDFIVGTLSGYVVGERR